jgi:salicylate hydroxylase
MAISKVLILGGGISGVGAALALSALSPSIELEIEVYELRPQPSTLGGAVNLIPNCLRYLHEWGVTTHLQSKGCEVPRIELFALRTGKPIGQINFDNVERYKFRALRVPRWDLLQCMLEALKETKVKIHYGKTAMKITSGSDNVQLEFQDGTTATGDILLGCDGIHSFARMSYVEPELKPIYTGIAVASCMADASCFTTKPPFESTGMFSGSLGSFMMSYSDKDKKTMYAAVVMETTSAESKDGWRLRRADQIALKENILSRFGNNSNKTIEDFVNAVEDWSLFPVYKLSNNGKWFRERCILLGDAAHAVSCSSSLEYWVFMIVDASTGRKRRPGLRGCCSSLCTDWKGPFYWLSRVI